MAAKPSPIPDIEPKHVRLLREDTQAVIDGFHELLYARQSIMWMGHNLLKSPFDMWVYQEILNVIRPELIVEFGTWKGGSALYFAHLCELLNNGIVVSVDIKPWANAPKHDRICHITGDSSSKQVIKLVHEIAKAYGVIMVILDSDHHKEHVLKELDAYWDIVTPGSFLVVEDTNVNGHPVYPAFGPGPHEAVQEWIKTENGQHYMIDKSCERFLISSHQGGYLRRVK